MVVIAIRERFPRLVNELWWLGLLQGTLAIFFGITAIAWPALTLITLVYLFSAFILGWGIVEIVHGLLSIRRRGTWWLTLLFGLVGLGVGVYLLRNPNISFAAFIIIVGLTLVVRGILDVVGAFIERVDIARKALLIFIGIAALIAGIVILKAPVAGGVAFVWVLGLYALVFGALMMVMAFEARATLSELAKTSSDDKPSEETEPTTREKTRDTRTAGNRRNRT